MKDKMPGPTMSSYPLSLCLNPYSTRSDNCLTCSQEDWDVPKCMTG